MLPILLRRKTGILDFDDRPIPLAGLERLWDCVLAGSWRTVPQARFNVDIWDDREHVYLAAEVPGLERRDISVTVEGDVLTIQGEKKHEDAQPKHCHYLRECCYGSFSRSFTLPSSVDSRKIEVTLEKGVLHVVLEKLNQAEVRRIEVKGG